MADAALEREAGVRFGACRCGPCCSGCSRRPGWPLPEEAERLMEAGYADRLMLDWWNDYPDQVYMLAPAVRGYEGARAPDPSPFAVLLGEGFGTCTFLTGAGLCEVHDSGAKPIECRILHCAAEDADAYHAYRQDVIVRGVVHGAGACLGGTLARGS